MRIVAAVSLMAMTFAPLVEAQTSVYGVSGLGYPSSAWSARSRALGGSTGVLDQTSAVNPASAAGFRVLGMSLAGGSQFRSYEIDGTSVEGLRSTRISLAILGGPMGGSPIAFSLSFASYLDRTYDVATTDTIVLRGDSVGIADRRISDGGIADVRGAVGWYLSDRLWIGAGLHLLSGSTREIQARTYDTDLYANMIRTGDIAYRGIGFSAGVMASPASWLQTGVSVRAAGSLSASTRAADIATSPMPREINFGLTLAPARTVRVSGAVAHRTWSRASGGLFAPGVQAFDTWEVGTGVELPPLVGSVLPLRLGFRYTQLPFSPATDQPREIVFAGGTGFDFAAGRATMDLTLERVARDGAGAAERAWQWQVELRVRP
ncbi:MAG TPA: hypothetical protein VGA22_01840 [Gemmatimonadales bacterium]